MRSVSAANRRRWKNPANRKRQSDAVRGRKFTPREPPPLPAQVKQLARHLAPHGITILGVTPALGNAYPRPTWILTAVDPDPAIVCHRWERYVADVALVLYQCKSQPLLSAGGVGVACVVGPAS